MTKKKKNSLIKILFILNFLLTKFCKSESDDSTYCSTQACERESKNILKRLDTSIDACDDFYMYVCGKFVAETSIPDDKTSVDVSTVTEDKLKEQLNEILNQTISESDIEPIKHSKKLYRACMNEDLIKQQGLKPLKQQMEALGGWPVVEGKNWQHNRWSWQLIVLELEMRGFSGNYLFDCSIDTDMKNSTLRAIYIDQMSLGLDRELLIEGFDDESVAAYFSYAVDTAVIYGADRFNAELEMKDVLNFEIALANISIPKEERRNMSLMYNPIQIREFQRMFPIHDWYKYLNRLIYNSSITEDEIIILTDFQEIIDKLYNLLKNTPNRVIVNYLFWRMSSSVADLLNDEIRNRHIQFTQVISGQQTFEKRWEECVDTSLSYLSIATSSLYVKNFFPHESREIAIEMVEAIRNEFEIILNETEWMDEVTKEAAIGKVQNMLAFIGYPDELLDDSKLIEYYKDLTLDGENYFESILNISKFEVRKLVRNFRTPVDKTDWKLHAYVAIINAFYDPLENSIQVPAGILQGVYFAADRPKYLNYAAIGSIIGHEISHGFDDEGSQFDASGNLVNWWLESTKDAYLEKAQCIIDQYSNFTENITGLNINGISTQGENIADNGGLRAAYNAYLKNIRENGEELPLPDLNLTSRQLFWVSAASQWCSVDRPEAMKLQIVMDAHSPEHFRVNGPMANNEEFAHDFNCPLESKMNSADKCRVW